MRLLPRSSRGTWLVAAAAWLAACYGVWYFVPAYPRIVIDVGSEAQRFQFSPDSENLVVYGWGKQPDYVSGSQGLFGQIRYWDVASGQQVGETIDTWAETPFEDSISPDRRWWYLSRAGPPPSQPKVFDVANRQFVTLPSLGGWRNHYVAFTPDSRFMIVENFFEEHCDLVVWDLHQQRIHATLRNLQVPFQVSPDSRLVAAITFNSYADPKIEIVDLQSLQTERHQLDKPGEKLIALVFSGDGSRLAAMTIDSFEPNMPLGYSPARLLRSWPVSTEDSRAFSARSMHNFVVVPDSRKLLTWGIIRGNWHLVYKDLETGESEKQFSVFDDDLLMTRFHTPAMGPPGDVLIAQRMHTATKNLLDRIRDLVGYPRRQKFQFPESHSECHFYSIRSGRHLGEIPGWDLHRSPDGRSVAVYMQNYGPVRQIAVWDYPLRKSLAWLAAGAVLLAFPIAFVARRRVRKLRAAS